jgi:hypothetical protein
MGYQGPLGISCYLCQPQDLLLPLELTDAVDLPVGRINPALVVPICLAESI